jgi:hypothetical protein
MQDKLQNGQILKAMAERAVTANLAFNIVDVMTQVRQERQSAEQNTSKKESDIRKKTNR